MPGACSNALQPYACEWTIGYLWRWTDLLERVVLVALAVTLVRVILLSVLAAYRMARLRRATDFTTGARRTLAADLSIKVKRIRLISLVAPYLGLVGACIGILSTFRGYIGTMQGFVIMVVSGIQAALLSTAAGILVAVPATLSHNYLRTRIDLLENSMSHGTRRQRMLSLRARLSVFPFAPIAASVLAVIFVVFIAFPRFHNAKGLPVSLVPTRCEDVGDDRLIVLRLTETGNLFINQTEEDENSLPELLSKIYGTRVRRTLYLLAEDGVPFQRVADALDIVENTSVEPHQAIRTGSGRRDIAVQLITPQAMNTSCVLSPVAIGSTR
jgi:biopolymer transport protein ExbD